MQASRVLWIPVIALATSAAASITGGTFQTTGSDTAARFFHEASLLTDGRVMVSGGMGLQPLPPSLVSLTSVSFYDADTGVFSATYALPGGGSTAPALATARSSHTQTTLADGRVLITGGRTGASGTSPGTAIDLVELFDPITGVMSSGPAMSAVRAAHTATRLADGRVVIAGGGTWQVLTPAGPGSDTWSLPVAMAHTRTAHAAVALPDFGGAGDHRVLLVGGAGAGATTLERIDPDGASTTLLTATLPVGVDDLAAARLDDGTVLIVGGQELFTGDTVASSFVYDPVADSLSAVPDPPGFPGGLADHELVGLGRYAAVFGGEEQESGVDIELDGMALYDRIAEGWVFNATMTAVHDDFASVVLGDGRVLLIDGGVPLLGQEAPSNVVELFIPGGAVAADIDCDGSVNVGDLLRVLADWGACPDPCLPPCPADVSGDCSVDVTDLLQVLADWS